jgi:hypothetical protein
VRASRWEILGAWLRIWTPPRDVEIPPVPRRRVAVGAALCAAAVVAGILLVVPALDRSKDERAASERAHTAAVARAERVRLRFDQRAQSARAPEVARLHGAGDDRGARAALLRSARASVTRDARARVAAGEFDVAIRRVRCRPRAGRVAPLGVRLSCLAITSETDRVSIGQPFIVAGSLRDGRYAWCHVNPPPAEGAAGVGVFVPVPDVCKG